MSIHLNIKRVKFIIKGQVQGVGFRPFVYKLAKQLDLKGYVQNDNIGVVIEVEGDINSLQTFESSLTTSLPPLAKIDSIKKQDIIPLYKGQFEIIQSKFQPLVSKIASVPPDIALCKDCKLDINKIDKYKNYFNTNCTNCGPRYSIIQTVPYDRENTSMKNFILCKSCLNEYKNPLNRRYHAQPMSCKYCGPTLELTKTDKSHKIKNDVFLQTISLLKSGKIGAIKGIGGFHIVCDATNTTTIKTLRDAKNRPTKPLAIMCKNIEQIKSFATITLKEEEVLQSKEAPIVILKKSNNQNTISNLIAPNIDRIGCMLPYSAFYYILFQTLSTPLVVTSANLKSEPIITTKEDIKNKLPFIDFIVDYNRDIVNAIDDSVVQVVNNDIQTLRLSRGYAPKELKLPFKLKTNILSCGANQKSTIALAFDDKLILSPYIGDLDNINSTHFLEKTIDTFKKFYDFKPDIIIADKHQGYESTKIAQTITQQSSNIDLIQIQHHLAHLYSVKAEYNLKKDYVGFIFDGTGLGDDDKLWGGEVFVGDKRKYHFKPLKLLGGEKAIKECKRVALSLLFDRYKDIEKVLSLDIATTRAFKQNEIKILYNMWQKNLNSPYSSSVGRLFDAVASLSGRCQIQSYEGEAGLLTEQNTIINLNNTFSYTIVQGIIDIDFDFFVSDIVEKFYATLINIIIDIAKKENLPLILSGGVFQNKTLLENLSQELIKQKIKHYYNKTIPTNDSGISVGQIYKYITTLA